MFSVVETRVDALEGVKRSWYLTIIMTMLMIMAITMMIMVMVMVLMMVLTTST